MEGKISSDQFSEIFRSLVDTIGSKRFKIKDHWVKDGYLVANVSWVDDEPAPVEGKSKKGSIIHFIDEAAIATATNKLKDMLESFLQGIPAHKRLVGLIITYLLTHQGFFQHYGAVPDDPVKLSFYFASFLPIHDSYRLPLLKMTNVKQRLDKIIDLMQIVMNHE